MPLNEVTEKTWLRRPDTLPDAIVTILAVVTNAVALGCFICPATNIAHKAKTNLILNCSLPNFPDPSSG
jgi:hypothetical protein